MSNPLLLILILDLFLSRYGLLRKESDHSLIFSVFLTGWISLNVCLPFLEAALAIYDKPFLFGTGELDIGANSIDRSVIFFLWTTGPSLYAYTALK